MKDIEAIAADVVNIALQLHRRLGPGLFESVYETLLATKLSEIGYSVARQVPIGIEIDGLHFDAAFRADLLIDDQLIVEIKSVDRLSGAHAKQLLTYLRLTDRSLGLLINFSGETLKEGLKRVFNNHTSTASSRLRVNQINRSN